MSDELEKSELIEPPKMADKLARSENISTSEQNHDYAQALASNPDQFPSIANLRIPNADQIEPFQLVDGTKSIAASRKIEQSQPAITALDSFNQGLLALPEGTTPEQLAQFQIEYINRKANSIEAASTLPAISSQFMLEGYAEKSQPIQENNEFYERMAGTLIGTVQGIGNIAVNLAFIADFCAYAIIGDRERGSEMLSNFGNALADTAMSGVKLFQAADNYLFQVGFEGDYSKPFKDISTVAQAINEHWQKLPPREQERIKAELITQLLADGLIGAAGTQSIGKANKFTEVIDTVAENVNKTLVTSKEKIKRAAAKLSNTIDELVQPIADTGTGIKMKVPKADDLALKMEGQQPSKAYRGDDKYKSKVSELGRLKSYINEHGDLVPADITGIYNGRPVDVVDHVCGYFYDKAKTHSPFTSLTIKEGLIVKFGNEKITVNLDNLRKAIKQQEIAGTEIIEHDELLELIKNSHQSEHKKRRAIKYATKEHEMLVKGVIPARFLEIGK